MKLYHGTTLKVARRAMKSGLKPRGRRKGNWDHTVLSRPDCVYLTNAYPLYFMFAAVDTAEEDFGAVIEIDTDLLNLAYLLPDEDAVAQTNRDSEYGDSLLDRTAYFRDNLVHMFLGTTVWEQSLAALGTCCYFGVIPPEAITRYVRINRKKNTHLQLDFDPTITCMNFRLLGNRYRACSIALFGDEPGEDLIGGLASGISRFDEWRPRLVDAAVISRSA